ncbi:MAG: GAF domain-containing protein, partial [Methanosarcinaceae archaeon]|nr:GAF domain-containing protein [Methanosarcinaceae archaeon]
EAEQFLEIDRALGTTLSSTWSLKTRLEEVLNACLQADGIDSGGIYLVDELLDQINLVAYRGFSSEFVERVSIFKAESSEAGRIMKETPTYELSFFSEKLLEEVLGAEGLQGVAVIPLKYKGEIIGSLNLASHSTKEIAPNIRVFLETIALQAVNYIAPIRIEAELV